MGRIYVALDTESTGAGSESNDVFEIAAVKFRDDEVLETWHSLVKPASLISYKVSQLTGISQKEVESAPLIHTLAAQVLRFVGDLPVVGHSIEFDLQALAAGGIKLRGPSYDTFELATLLLPEVGVYTLGKVAAALGIAHPDAHRAMADAEVTMQVFRALLQRIDEIELAALAEINRATANSNWALRGLFQEAEREKTRSAFSLPTTSIGAALLAKGARAEALELGMLRPPALPPPLEITDEVVMVDEQAIAAALSPDGALARLTPGYEHRPAQVQMATAVTRALNEGSHLIVEAGTGTGKSMAYLLPAIDFAVRNGQRVVVSTNTINLQEQLFHKDIPALQTALADRYEQVKVTQGGRDKRRRRGYDEQQQPFTAALIKGRSNYLCLRRWATFRKLGELSHDEVKLLVKGLVWLPTTNTGDRAELLLIGGEYGAWERVCAQAEACDLNQCPALTNGLCFLHRARGQAEGAHIVVVNHALLL
ncbi:MAG: DNA polymerase III subunit epsilon, partial [Candidatus Chloroheliales bacterium]